MHLYICVFLFLRQLYFQRDGCLNRICLSAIVAAVGSKADEQKSILWAIIDHWGWGSFGEKMWCILSKMFKWKTHYARRTCKIKDWWMTSNSWNSFGIKKYWVKVFTLYKKRRQIRLLHDIQIVILCFRPNIMIEPSHIRKCPCFFLWPSFFCWSGRREKILPDTERSPGEHLLLWLEDTHSNQAIKCWFNI